MTSLLLWHYERRVPDSDKKRSARVGELIKHELAELITNELKDPRVGFVTVTEVRVPGDLRSAKVFVSIYGDDEGRQSSLAGLNAAAGFLKRELGRRLQLRHVPELTFVHDESLDRADRLQALMNAIAHGETETPDTELHQAVPVDTARTALAERQQHFSEERQRNKKKTARRRTRGRKGTR